MINDFYAYLNGPNEYYICWYGTGKNQGVFINRQRSGESITNWGGFWI